MALEVLKDPRDGSEFTMISGVVDQIFIKEIANGADKYGNTHRAGVRIGDHWVNNVNIKTKEGNEPQVRFNAGTQADPKWTTLEVGDDVRMEVNPNEWNGKISYNGAVSKIVLVKKGAGGGSKPQAPQGGQVAQQKRDFTGVEVGHAINAALNFMENVDFSKPEDIVEVAKKFHTLTVQMKKAHADANPKMTDYDVGASVGHAVLNASKLSADFESVEEIAKAILNGVVDPVFDFVRAGSKEVEKPKTAAKTAKKTAAKKTVQTKQPDPDPTPDDDYNPTDDDDDSIPF